MFCDICGAITHEHCKCLPFFDANNLQGPYLLPSKMTAVGCMRPSTRLAVTDGGKIMQAWQCINTGKIEWRELERYEDLRQGGEACRP